MPGDVCDEAELLASVSHPHVLAIYDYGTTADKNLPYLVTEYIEEGDLRRQMSKGHPMPIDRVRLILGQVGKALEFLHGKGIIHRDLKPENILMPAETDCKVGDFGLAVMQDKAGLLTRSIRGLGTPGYVSPEQQYGLKIDERTDQYSLAALGYELMTGRRPLGQIQPPSRHNAQLSRELDAVLLRGLAEEPRDRFPSVTAFLTAFERSLVSSPRRGIGRRNAIMATVAVVLCVCCAAAFVKIGPRTAVRGPVDDRAVLRRSAGADGRPDNTETNGVPASAVTDSLATSPELRKLVELRAYKIWVDVGSPTGKLGEAVKDRNWADAEKQIKAEVDARAYQLWVQQGSPVGPDGESASKRNRHEAVIQLLKEIEQQSRRSPTH